MNFTTIKFHKSKRRVDRKELEKKREKEECPPAGPHIPFDFSDLVIFGLLSHIV